MFLNENILISIKISLKFVPKGPIDNKAALYSKVPILVQVMALCFPVLTQIYVTI